MENLINISQVLVTYGISARTLRYYEDIGLLTSTRKSETTARFYTDSELKRLHHILMLRKLSISIKDIQLIFKSNEANTLFSILDHKVTDVDKEIAELYHLKLYINNFLAQLKKLTSDNEVNTHKLLEEINTLEVELASYDNAEKIPMLNSEMPLPVSSTKVDVRLISLPACKMVSSGYGNLGDKNFEFFDQWFSKFPIDPYAPAKDFLWYDPIKNANVWWYIYSPEMDTCGLSIDSFDGGLYACAVSKDEDDIDGMRVYQGILKWIEESDQFETEEYPNHYAIPNRV